jgi:ABC-type uncharacterized transport system ATPase subunit
MTEPIVINKLPKDFGGFKAVDDLSLHGPPQVVHGIPGQRGGKTTSIKILTNMLSATLR